MNSVATTYVGLRSKGDICGPAPAYGSIGKVQAAAYIRMIVHGGINGQGQSHSVSTKSSPPSSFSERTECPLCATGARNPQCADMLLDRALPVSPDHR